jgi:hypothetical protein
LQTGLSALLKRKQIDTLGVQAVKSHLPVSVQGYEWLPGLDRFIRPQHNLGIGFLVNERVQGLVRIAAVNKLHGFMWLELAGKGPIQDTFIWCVYY